MFSSNNPHFNLFVDLNGTIIVGDSVRDKGMEDALWQMISENTVSTWPLSDEEMTYREYIEKHLCPNNSEIPPHLLKQQRKQKYNEVVEYLKKHSHPMAEEIQDKYLCLKEIFRKNTYIDQHGKECKGSIVPSFINLIKALDKIECTYSVILSTFGDDAKQVVSEIQQRTSVRFSKNAEFKKGDLIIGAQKTSDPKMMHAFFSKNHVAVKHDYNYWSSHHETFEYGKPFPVSLEEKNPRVISIFFDDNALSKQIISVKPLSNKAIDQEKIQKLLIKSKHIVPVNIYDAILSEDYFLNIIRMHFYHFKSKNNKYLNHGIASLIEEHSAELCGFGENILDSEKFLRHKN